jgi:3-oxoadipate enol-lactonase
MRTGQPSGHGSSTISPDGTRIAWMTYGNDSSPAIVMMHSLGSNGSMWVPQISALTSRFRVVAVDTRGHGRSAAPPGDYHLDQLGADVLAVADHIGIEQFHAVGLSLGGQMAMWLGLNAPARVRSLVLANTAAKIGTDELWQARIDAVTADGMASLRDAVLARWFAPDFADRHPDWFASAQDTFSSTEPLGYAGCCAALRESDLRTAVGAIAVPTLIVGGELDLATPPADVRWLHQHIPASELTILEHAAHLSNLDRAPQFTARLTEFLSTALYT